MNHAVFQVLATLPNGDMEAGTAWFSRDAQEYARQTYPHLAKNSLYALTNAHVVRGASSLFSRHVCMRRQDLPLSVCGVAGDVDLALVRLSGRPKQLLEQTLRERTGVASVPMLQMADSDRVVMPAKYDPLAPDSTVVAVGHPLGSEFQTRTCGVVEGFKRVQGMGTSDLYCAHTATIQPGNSGGPLLHQNRVVGINSMKATGATTDNLNMAIPSRRILSYLPALLDESQQQLAASVVGLVRRLGAQGTELHLLDAQAQEPAMLGDAEAMHTAYAAAMQCDDHACCGDRTVPYPTLGSLVTAYAHKPGFHRLLGKVCDYLHTGNHAKLHRLVSKANLDNKLCGHCQRGAEAGGSMFCVSPVPSKLVHSPSLSFDYKPASALTRQALGVPELTGGVVVSEVLPYGALSDRLQPYDIISEVYTHEGTMPLSETGEHYRSDWGLSLGLRDLVDRAPLGTQVGFKVHRDGQTRLIHFERRPLMAEERPAVRALDASEAHLNAAVTVGGVSFKVLRLTDIMADPRIAQSPASEYAQPLRRHLEKVVVSNVDPTCAAFHNFSLMPGHVVSHIGKQALPEAKTGVWRQFVTALAQGGNGGLAMLGTEGGGIDTVPVSETEAQQLALYLQASAV
jgi:S1-C subfamily serine protease